MIFDSKVSSIEDVSAENEIEQLGLWIEIYVIISSDASLDFL